MKSLPSVTVLMPVYNASVHLREAIDSIIIQTYFDFEFLIIEDGSTDNSKEIILSYNDNRIRCIYHNENKGLIFSLNEGLNEAKGELIVRMDADDISYPSRIQKQVEFLIRNPTVDLAGTLFKLIGSNVVYEAPISHDEIRSTMLFGSSIAHPSVILRKSSFALNSLYYDSKFKHAEDYQLWILASQKLKFSNIPEVLLNYRSHPDQVSFAHNAIQIKAMFDCQKYQLECLGVAFSKEDLLLHQSLLESNFIIDKNYAIQVLDWFKKIKIANSKSNFFNSQSLNLILFNKWISLAGLLLKENCKIGSVFYKNHFEIKFIKYYKAISFYFLKSIIISCLNFNFTKKFK